MGSKGSSASAVSLESVTMRDIPDQTRLKVERDADHMREEKFLDKWFGTLMRRFDDVEPSEDYGWEVASENYNEDQLTRLFVRSLKSVYDGEVSTFGHEVYIKTGKHSMLRVAIYPDPNASTWTEKQKGYSVSWGRIIE